MVSSLGTRSPYVKWCISIINGKSVLGCSFSFDSVFQLFVSLPCLHIFQQHRRIWTVPLEDEGDLHQSNQVQAAIERVHKTQQQLRKFQVLKKLRRIPPHFPYNNRGLGQQNNPSNSMWKMSPGRADFSFPQLLWFSLCFFCSATTLSGHHMLHHRRGQWIMPATKGWEDTLEGLANMTPHCFYMPNKMQNHTFKGQRDDPHKLSSIFG